MKKLLCLALMSCSPYVAPEVPDAGVPPIAASAYTFCNAMTLGREFCGKEHEIISCDKYHYDGKYYLVWTTDGRPCE